MATRDLLRPLKAIVDRFYRYRIMHIDRARMELAMAEAARYIEDHCPLARSFPNRSELIEEALLQSAAVPGGLVCEFGVYKGASINFIAAQVRGTVHGFDAFQGLPERFRSTCGPGALKVAHPPRVLRNVVLHTGWFAETLPSFLAENPGPAAFLHLDADLYSSTKTVLDLLAPRIVPGTVILLDDFFAYAGWRQQEFRAFMEFVDTCGVRFDYLGYNRTGQQVAVRVTASGGATAIGG